jgi:hypothetical protein
MPKPFSRRLDALLAAYKGDNKPKKAKVTPTVSSYAGTDSSSFSTDFGTGHSGLADLGNGKKEFQTTATLAPELAGIGRTAGEGLASNLAYLQRDPEQRVDWATGGNDPWYNVLAEQNKRATQEAIGRQLVNGQQGGITNSTTMGSALGRIANDDILRRNQILLGALDYGNQNARADAGLNMSTLTGLNGLITPYGSAAAAQLQTAKGSQDQAQAATAAAQNAAEQQYVSAMNQYNMQKQASMGQMVSAGLGMLGTIGGNMVLPGVGGMIGGSLARGLAGSISPGSLGGSMPGSGVFSPGWGNLTPTTWGSINQGII